MRTFGELIVVDIPVLMIFYTEGNEESNNMHPVMRDVSAHFGNLARVVKIDIDKNQELTEAMRVKSLPTLMIYKDGEQVWRHTGIKSYKELVELIKRYE